MYVVYICIHTLITDVVTRIFSLYFLFINDMQESSLFLYIYYVNWIVTKFMDSNGFLCLWVFILQGISLYLWPK